MPKLPHPPAVAELVRIGPEIAPVHPGTPLTRIFRRGGAHPGSWNAFRHWGPLRDPSRFDHHLPDAAGQAWLQDRGTLYAALGPEALTICVAEVFQTKLFIDKHHDDPWLAVFEPVRELQLLDVTGYWPTRAGASAAIATGPKRRTSLWSRAIFEAYPDLDGILYRSSMGGNGPAVALYERAATALPSVPSFHRPLTDPALDRPLLRASRLTGYDLP